MARRHSDGYGRELLDSIAEHATSLLENLEVLRGDQAKQFGSELAIELARAWGGQMIYIPRALFNERLQRDELIWSEFAGNNHAELARKYKISLPFVYRIVRRMRERDHTMRQSALPL